MSVWEWAASVLLGSGVLLAAIAAIGLARFDNVLARMHAGSKPQTLGLALVLAGTAVVLRSWSAAGFLLLVLLAQMLTVPAASSLVGRAAFRRGFVRGGEYAIDELSPRLAGPGDEDEDGDGFADDADADGHDPLAALPAEEFPHNPVAAVALEDAARDEANWADDEPGDDAATDTEALDIDLSAETEREAGEIEQLDAEARRAREQPGEH